MFVAAMRALMSLSSRRLQLMSDPKYHNVRMKVTMPSATLKSWVSSSLSYISWSRLMLSSLGSSDF